MGQHELGGNPEDLREQLATQFNHIVQLATKPEMDMRESGRCIPIYGGAKLAGNTLSIGGNSITYSKYDISKTGYKSFDLGFQPEYSVSIIQRHSFFNTFIDRATFGVNQNGVIARGLHEGHEIFGSKLIRELDEEESRAVVEFIASPHLHLDKLDIIYRLSDEEKATLHQQEEHLRRIQRESEKRQRGRRVRVPRLGN